MRPLERMLVVANTDWFVANYLNAFLQAHLRAGIEVVAGSPAGPYSAGFKQEGLGWREIPMSRGRGSLGSNLAAAVAMARLEHDFRPDLIHRVTAKPVILGLMLRPGIPGARVIHALPGLGYAFSDRGLGARLDRWVQRMGIRQAARRRDSLTVFQNEADRALVLGGGTLALRAGRVIPGWGVDLARFSRPHQPADPPLVIMISRMLWGKGVGDFVQAASLALAQSHARFALVGDPDLGNPSYIPSRQLEAWQMQGPVEWWGHRQDISDLLARACVAVLPTRYGEGAPQSLIEAAAAGVPIVASDIPGCRQVVVNGINGYLVPPGDIKALAQAISHIVQDPDMRARMGENGKAIARERFALDRVLPWYAEVYKELGLEADLSMSALNGPAYDNKRG